VVSAQPEILSYQRDNAEMRFEAPVSTPGDQLSFLQRQLNFDLPLIFSIAVGLTTEQVVTGITAADSASRYKCCAFTQAVGPAAFRKDQRKKFLIRYPGNVRTQS
jgi:hypothetical protein